MKSRAVRLSMTAAAIIGLMLAVNVPAASAKDKNTNVKLVVYSKTVGLHTQDGNSSGIDHGDLFYREQAISLTPGGPIIGVAYSQAEVVSHHEEDNVDVRRITIQEKLPKGVLYVNGLTELVRGELPRPGWTATYAVVGGTGKYAKARGTSSLLLMPDGMTFKVTYRLSFS